jgi:hypothetical protein
MTIGLRDQTGPWNGPCSTLQAVSAKTPALEQPVASTLNSDPRVALPVPNPAVVFRTVSDGAVLLHVEHEVYFGLNAVGAEVWQLLPPHCADLDELCVQLHAHYPEARLDVLRSDVSELLAQLRENGLLTVPE